MTRITLMVNQITPYRVPVYQRLAEAFQMTVLHGGKENNRTAWKDPEKSLKQVKVKKSWGFQIAFRKKDPQGKFFDYKYIHITPGYAWDLLKSRPDAVITVEMGFRTVIALLYGMICRKPVWIWSGVTCHSERSLGRVKKTLRWFITRSSSRWISYGQAATEYLQGLGIPRLQIVQIQNCVDERLFLQEVDPALHISPKPVLLYVGQLIQRKGIDRLLAAVRELQQQGYQFSLVLVGEGEDQELRDYVAMHQLEHVHFLGGKAPEEMPGIYRSANFFVFPTLEDIWGLVVNEALLSGVPVLSSIYADCTREILPAENLFDPNQIDDIVRSLKLALDGKIAPADLSPLWTHRQVAQKIIDDITKILERGSHPSVFQPRSSIESQSTKL